MAALIQVIALVTADKVAAISQTVVVIALLQDKETARYRKSEPDLSKVMSHHMKKDG